MANRSIVEFFGRGDGHQCGYCKAEDKNISSGNIIFFVEFMYDSTDTMYNFRYVGSFNEC